MEFENGGCLSRSFHMPKDLVTLFSATAVAAVLAILPGSLSLFGDDPDVAKRCQNQALAPFVPLDAGWRIAATSQAIDKIGFSDPYPKSGRKLDAWTIREPAKTSYGHHYAWVIFGKTSAPGANQQTFAPVVSYQLQLLPNFESPKFLGVKPWGRLIGHYFDPQMSVANEWFPSETKLGIFGATFSTQIAETAQGDREFVRVPTPDSDQRACFSLPIDLADNRTMKDAFGVPREKMPPQAAYEDLGNTEWMIYSRILADAVEISTCETRWNYGTNTPEQIGAISIGVYKFGAPFQVSNLKFRINEIVCFDTQEVPAAWVNISDLDIVRPRATP